MRPLIRTKGLSFWTEADAGYEKTAYATGVVLGVTTGLVWGRHQTERWLQLGQSFMSPPKLFLGIVQGIPQRAGIETMFLSEVEMINKLLIIVVVFWVSGCVYGHQIVIEKVPDAYKQFSPKSRIGIVGFEYNDTQGKLPVGYHPSSFTRDLEKDVIDILIPFLDQELQKQSKGIIEYVPLVELKKNQLSDYQAFVRQLTKENQLDGLIELDFLGNSNWAKKKRGIVFWLHMLARVSNVDHEELFMKLGRYDWSYETLPHRVPPKYIVGPDGKPERIPGMTWDKSAYYSRIAKAEAANILRAFKTGPFRVISPESLTKDGHPPLIPGI